MRSDPPITVPIGGGEAPAHLRAAPGSWWSLGVLWLLYVGSFVDRIAITMVVAPIKRDLALSDVQVSLVLAAFAISYVVFGYPMGWAADRFPRRIVIYLGTTFWALSAMGSGLSRNFVQLFLCRLGVGGGEAALSPAAYSLLGDKFPRSQLTFAMSVYQSGSQVGTAIAFAVSGAILAWATTSNIHALPLVGHLEPWQLTLVLTGAPLLILSLLAFTLSEPRRSIAPVAARLAAENQSILAFMRQEWRLYLPMVIGFALVVTAVGSLFSWAPTYVARQFGLKPAVYGPALGFITFLSAATMLLKGLIVDWMTTRGIADAPLRFFSWLVAAALPAVALAFWLRNPTAFLILYGLVQALIGQFAVYATATLHHVTPHRFRGQMIGIFMALFGALGFGAGPVIVALITDRIFHDEQMLGTSLQIVGVVSLAIALIFLKYSRRAVLVLAARA